MFCANCGKELPEGTKFCGYCGAPTGAAKAEAKEVTEPEKETAEATAEVTKENVASATETAAASSEASAPAPEPKKKKGRGGLIAGIIAACVGIVAIVAGVIFFTGKNFEHTMHKTFDKPKDYYSYLEKKNIETLSEKMKSEPVQKVLDQMKQVDASFKETVKIKIGSKGKEYTALASAAGVDLSWLESVGISCDANVKDDCFSMNLSPILNDVNLFQLAFMMDVKGGMIYAALPDLSEKYFGVSLGDGYDYEMIKGEMSKVMDAYNEMMACYPDPETMQEIILKYYDLIMENVEEVAKEKATLEVGDISVDCTLIRIELSNKDVQKIVKAILTEMKKDKDIEKMILNMYEALAKYGDDEELNGEKMYEEFQKGLDDAMENLDDIKIKSLVIENYVDKTGEIVGRNITTKQEDETVTIKYADVAKGDDKAFECTVNAGDKSFGVTGTGKEKSGKFDGEFVVSVDKKKYVNLVVEGYDVKAAEEGNLIGTFTIKPGKDADLTELMENIAGEFSDSPVAALISAINPSLKLDLDVTMEKHKVELSLLDGGSELITISMSGELNSAKNIDFPKDYIELSTDKTPDESVIVDYVKSLDLDKVIDALERANVPSEWTDILKQYKSYLPQLIESQLY